MADWNSSLDEQLKSFVNNEFKNHISVPSLAESSDFGILYFCSPKPVEQSFMGKIKKAVSWPSNLGQAANTESSANLISLGWLFDYCLDNSGEVKLKEVPVCIQDSASASQVSGSMEFSPDTGCGGSFHNKKVLDLGKIVKISVPYKEVSCWLKGVTTQSSPELFKEAKKNHLYVIYEVLTAEHLKIGAEEDSNFDGNMSGKGSGSWKRKKGSRLARPKSMGRYTFAYKCGRVRVKKKKSHLELVGPKEFYEPFQIRDQNELPPTIQSRKY